MVHSDGVTAVGQWYTDALARHGLSSAAVGWRTPESQVLRFARLGRVLDDLPADQPLVIADYGCGYGAMFPWLDQRLGPRLAQYVGYDVSRPMLEAARGLTTDPRAVWVEGSRLDREVDVTFVSGTFNVRLDLPPEAWHQQVLAMLDDIAAHSRLGFAFNLLTTWVDWQDPGLYYADPTVFFRHCRDHYGRYVALYHDYPLFEWTMTVRRDPAGA